MNIEELIFDLCSVCGVSGSEEPAVKAANKYLADFAEVKTDCNGNLFAVLGNKDADKTILLDSHIDRIGFMVTGIDDSGFVKVSKCGGIDPRTLLDTELILQNNPDITGVVSCMPPHLSDGNEDKAVPMDKIWIDFGLTYEEAVSAISIGDALTFKSSPRKLLNNKIASACLDNRCGVAALIKCGEILSNCKDLKYKIVILLSVQEETFASGAKTGAFSANADEAVAVDVSFASQPDISGQYSGIELAKGPMICISPVLNRKMSDKFIETAKINHIPYQIEPVSGLTGTNADSIAVVKSGIKTAVISIPLKNMHTQNEIISIKDVENTAKLISEYIKCGGAFDD